MRKQHLVSGWQRLWTSALVGALLVSLMVPLAALARVDVAAQDVASVQGTVTESGTTQPIEGAYVSAEIQGGDGGTVASATTDATGHYVLELPEAGPYEIRVEAERYESQWLEVVYDGTPLTGQDFSLIAQVKWLFGNVTDAVTELPLANAYVQAVSGFDTYLAFTDVDGDYELWVGPTPRGYTVQVGKSGYHAQSNPYEFDGSSIQEKLDFELEPKDPGVYGRVTQSGSGNPIQGALVTLTFPGGTAVQVHTDEYGEYELLLASVGTYNITAAKAGYKPVSDSFTYNGVDSVQKDFALVPNATPVAQDDKYSTPMNTQLSVTAPGVLENDTDADGDTLTISEVTDPGNGFLEFASDGGFTYTPDPEFEGVDTFTYQAYDGSVLSNTAVVSITVGTTPVNYTITATVGTGGTISPSGAVIVEHGANKTFTVTPDAGYEVDTMTVDGQASALTDPVGNTYTFVNVTADHTIHVTFAPEPPPASIPIEGLSRFHTAVAASVEAYPDGSQYVIIATGRNWPDALGGTALAGALDAPILLSEPTSLPSVTARQRSPGWKPRTPSS
jgi:hypothetical protein